MCKGLHISENFTVDSCHSGRPAPSDSSVTVTKAREFIHLSGASIAGYSYMGNQGGRALMFSSCQMQ